MPGIFHLLFMIAGYTIVTKFTFREISTEKYKEKSNMKKVWKWILGILLGLIVIGVLVGVAFMVFGNFHSYRVESLNPRGFDNGGPGMMPFGGYGHMRGPGMMGFGRNPLIGFIGCLFSLGILALLVLGIIWLVRTLRSPKAAQAAPAVMPVETPAATPAMVTPSCKKCGQPLQADWKVCPHCGKKI
jgi:heme A synthase